MALPVWRRHGFAPLSCFPPSAALRLSRQRPASGPVDAVVVEHRDLMLEAACGLVLLFDPQGNVTGVGGRDRAEFLSWMRDPSGRGFVEQDTCLRPHPLRAGRR